MENESTFTKKQLHALPYLVKCPSVSQAAKEADVCPRQIWKWLQDPAYKREVDSQRNSLFSEAMARLKNASQKAVETLVSLLDSNCEKTKLSAAEKILSFAFKSKETIEIELRLEQIEQRLEQK